MYAGGENMEIGLLQFLLIDPTRPCCVRARKLGKTPTSREYGARVYVDDEVAPYGANGAIVLDTSEVVNGPIRTASVLMVILLEGVAYYYSFVYVGILPSLKHTSNYKNGI
ncbi:hypothetical protein M434DRAFT_11680 [Hypoxylon sp. CO27-5]|nr:hypothetical protein M434DRAFT_11680 [Hypoxylon sp. CO27-5]